MTLDLEPHELHELIRLAAAWVSEFYESATDRPILPDVSRDLPGQGVVERAPVHGVAIPELLADCFAALESSRHNGHPRFFGYIASPATPVAAVADLIASTFNANVASARGARGAAEMELTVIRWLGQLFGFADDAAGMFTSGGSMANLQALFVASREVAGSWTGRVGLRGAEPLTVYVSDQTHHSIAKAADILGIGTANVRIVPCDDRFRMDVAALVAMLEGDRASGMRPFCVVGTAGTTNTGAVDPLDKIADVAASNGLWFHVDGAYGVPATLDPAKRPLFAGLDRADSLTVDAHKWLYTSIDCSCLLLRDLQAARRAFGGSSTADYIRIDDQSEVSNFAFFDHGIELTRRFRALKLWATLRYYGTARIAGAIAHDSVLASYLGQLVEQSDNLELLAPVELGICCFRYLSDDLTIDLDDLNARLLTELAASNEAYLSNATVRGRYALRACITNYRTTDTDIDHLVAAVLAIGSRLASG